jgi:hypothetical protein
MPLVRIKKIGALPKASARTKTATKVLIRIETFTGALERLFS